MNSQKLEGVTDFKYLGATLCKDGTCSEEIRIRVVSVMAVMARLNRILLSSTISFASKFKLCTFLVTSILYNCETWTLLADCEKRIQVFETKCMKKFLRISYLERKANDWVPSKINSLVGPQEPLPAIGKRRKFAWYWHVTRHDSFSKPSF